MSDREEKIYTFYRNEKEKGTLKEFNWCQRPCNSNMSLNTFCENGEIIGWMSESLATEQGLEQITLKEFIHRFVKPLVKENLELKKQYRRPTMKSQ